MRSPPDRVQRRAIGQLGERRADDPPARRVPVALELVAAERRPVRDRLAEPHPRGGIAGRELGLVGHHALARRRTARRRQRQQQLPDRALVIGHAHVLGHVGDDPADRDLALVGRQRSGQDLEQRALARRRCADQADVLARGDAEGDVGEQQVAARMGISETRHRHVRHAPMLAAWRVVSLSGLRMTSSEVMRPPSMVTAITLGSRPISSSTPGAPLTVMRERCTARRSGRTWRRRCGPRARRREHGARRGHEAAAVAAEGHRRVQQLHQRGEIAVLGRVEERLHDLALLLGAGRIAGAARLDGGSRPRRQLAGRGRGATDDARHLLKGVAEHVVQQKRAALAGREDSSTMSIAMLTSSSRSARAAGSDVSSAGWTSGSGSHGPRSARGALAPR